jgi:hypothetical protein
MEADKSSILSTFDELADRVALINAWLTPCLAERSPATLTGFNHKLLRQF